MNPPMSHAPFASHTSRWRMYLRGGPRGGASHISRWRMYLRGAEGQAGRGWVTQQGEHNVPDYVQGGRAGIASHTSRKCMFIERQCGA